ncbi:hypothetical protein [Halobaculum sp. MBLA0143]|uniref:hypothetical protein n=1 Tax=Halobaculum sp. MBLA0143 TaxID=3079933 RepID=UPI0035232CD3
MRRRRLLAGAGVGLAATLAGCGSLSGVGGRGARGGSLPPYARSLPADGTTGLLYLDVGKLVDRGVFDGSDTETATPAQTPTPDEASSDPASALVAAPVSAGLLAALLGLGFGLQGYGDAGSRLVAPLYPDRTDVEDEVGLRGLTFVAGVVVATGAFDTAAFDDALPDGFETAAEREAYTVSTDGDEAAIAVSEEAIVVATGTFDDTDGPATAREAVTRVLDARLGTADRLADRSPDAEWVLRQAGTHDFVGGGENTSVDGADDGDRTYDPLAGTPLAGAQTSLIVSGASVELTGGEATNARADTALVNTGDAVSQSALESVYADSDATVSVTVSEAADGDDPGQRVHVTGEFGSAPSRL